MWRRNVSVGRELLNVRTDNFRVAVVDACDASSANASFGSTYARRSKGVHFRD